MPTPIIKLNSTGPDVKKWQEFLIGQGLLTGAADGQFGQNTQAATIAFQTKSNLPADGVVGNNTYIAATATGFNGTPEQPTGVGGADWPSKPDFKPLVNLAQRQAVFGTFTYVAAPVAGNQENIRITNDWARENIIMVPVPQLKNISGGTRVEFHKLAANQLSKLWADWEQAGLLHFVISWEGSYVPRLIRGSKTTLSNHSFGSAFDINAQWNGLNKTPALVGEKGCVRELVGIAHDNGFYWGGHFTRQDGMHFEVAKLM
jgi:hypothetical protein